MSANTSPSNKAKIARRVIEVLEFFDDDHREATVMDIVRRYDRPQSSTSELLSSLVELGLLHKDPHARSYKLTARAALLGAAGQTGVVRDGRLVRLMDRLLAQTGLSVGLFGMVGLEAQIVSWRQGHPETTHAGARLFGGMKAPLCDNAVGRLLLSTVDCSRREGLVRRLNAEATENRKFAPAEMLSAIEECRKNGYASGSVGYGSTDQIVAVLLPNQIDEQALAIGVVHDRQARINCETLLQCIDDAMRQCLAEPASAPVQHLSHAA